MRFTSLLVPAGGEVGLSLRATVRGVRGGDIVFTEVAFRTNDPAQPEGVIRAASRCISGGAVLMPDKLVAGRLPVGESSRQVVEVHDRPGEGRQVARVGSDRPDIIRVSDVEQVSGAGPVIARFTVEVRSDQPVAIDDSVRVFLRERPNRPDVFKVVGRVVAPVTVSPPEVLLPRQSATGPVYELDCQCRSTDGKPFELSVQQSPPGVRAEVTPEEGDQAVWRVRVSCEPGTRPTSGERPAVRLRASCGGQTHDVAVPVRLYE